MLIAKNKKGLFNNEVIEKYVAGIVLKGHEVKAIREKNVSFEGAYISIEDNIPVVKNLHIGKYSKQSQDHTDYNAKRTRQLLLNKNEIDKLSRQISEKGKTAIPLALITKKGKIKLELAVVKGRKKHEKRSLLKKRQIEIDLKKEIKQSGRLI